ncbi:hypothetical protein BHE74_00026547 [Ensete ventricosum]|nr:hypothetical protein BHE74_00026547 [Ensete ventricosum]
MRSLVLLLDHVEVTPCPDVKHSRVPSCIELRCEMPLDRVEVIDLSWINMWTHMAAKSSQSERGTMPILVSRRGYASKVRRFAVVLPFVSHIDKCQRRDDYKLFSREYSKGDWRGVEEDELSSEELLARAEAEDVDAEGYLHQRGDAAELLLRCCDLRSRSVVVASQKGAVAKGKKGEEESRMMTASATAGCSLRSHGGEAATVGWRRLRWQRRARLDSIAAIVHGRGLVAAANDNAVIDAGVEGSRQLRSNSRGSQLRLKKKAMVVAEEERRELPFDSNRKQLFNDEEGVVARSRAR